MLLLAVPGPALAVCFDVAGLPEAAGIDLVPLPSVPQAPIPLVGEAHGVCGLGQPPAVVQGTASTEANGLVRAGTKLLSARLGCNGGEAELVLPPFTSGTGQVRLPEGSVVNVGLTSAPASLPGHGHVAGAAAPDRPGPEERQRIGILLLPASGADPGNLELTVKVLDGAAVNDHYRVAVTPSTTSVE